MSTQKTISIGFKIEDGANGFKKLTMDAAKLREVMQANVVEAEKLHGRLINFASLSQTLDSVSSGLGSLQSAVKGLTAAYAVQTEAETKLEQVMRNTMNAREEDIQSIKDFCSAQQQIGIVGDEVQLAGAQELATYLELKGSLKSLIPVMNDMVAQQYGYNHNAENAVTIATMLGKVMQGQTSALSRLGYKFDEAQEKVLKYGTESERAAMLAQVVGESVGGMNAKLAQTDTGRMKQLENALGDIKEQLGGMAQGIEPILAMSANAAMAAMGVIKLVKGLQALRAALFAANAAGGAITLTVTALATAVGYFITRTDDSSKALDRQTAAQKRAAKAAEEAQNEMEHEAAVRTKNRGEIEKHLAKLKDFNGSKAEEKRLVSELNAAYGDTMGYYSTAHDWYEKLLKDSEKYCDQLVAEERVKRNALKIADLEEKKAALFTDSDGNAKNLSKEKTLLGVSDFEIATARAKEYDKAIASLKGSMAEAARTSASLASELFTGSAARPDLDGSSSPAAAEAPKGSIADIEGQIKDIQRKITFSTDPGEIAQLTKHRMELERQLGVLRLPIVIEEGKEEVQRLADQMQQDPIHVGVELDLPDSLEGLGLSEAGKEMAELVAKGIRLKGMAANMEKFADAAKLAGQTFSSLGQAFEDPALNVAGIIAGAIANVALGFAQASTQAAAMGPFAWAAFALSGVAEMAAVIAQIKSATAFADGGIVSGPTYALVGEYAGASNNPEVIAPLNKLKDIIGDTAVDSGAVIIGGTIRADGRTLAVVLENQGKAAAKSGRKLKI